MVLSHRQCDNFIMSITHNLIMRLYFLVMVIQFATQEFGHADDGFCPLTKTEDSCSSGTPGSTKRYLFYDVNHSEGFNLRRDVYMRLAIFMHKWTESHNEWVLVLPPWNHLYHWRSDLEQNYLPWRLFFDVESMKRFAPVIELDELEELVTEVDTIYYLEHFKEAFTSKDWDWQDRYMISPCNQSASKFWEVKGLYHSDYWGQDISSKELKCSSFQGGASLIGEMLSGSSHKKVIIDRAEVVLHDRFGDKRYWECRRSMVFAERLVGEANKFRSEHLNSFDEQDNTKLPPLWEDQKEIARKEKGGPYICAHLRRQDFVYGRSREIPSLENAANKLIDILKQFNLTTVFLSTDGSEDEKLQMARLLKDYTLATYDPSPDEVLKFKDGGVAVIDQIICSNARFFIGTHESTFSFRIQEEREIRGFPVEHTFNRFCGTNEDCEQPSKWKIVI